MTPTHSRELVVRYMYADVRRRRESAIPGNKFKVTKSFPIQEHIKQPYMYNVGGKGYMHELVKFKFGYNCMCYFQTEGTDRA